MKKFVLLIAIMAIIIGCSHVDDYYPFAVGNKWNYRHTKITPTDTFINSVDMEITGTTIMGGKEVWVRAETWPIDTTTYEQTTYIEETENYIITYLIMEGETLTDTLVSFPLEERKTWGNYVATAPETVTVPAGTYTDCWKITANLGYGYGAYWYLASNVGVVKSVFGGYDIIILELEESSIK